MVESFKRREVVAGALAAAAATLPTPAAAARRSAKRPNVIFILADDLGYADLSCFGQSDFKTPAIDRIAAAGIRLRMAYANSSVCSATRIGLATGCYQYRFRVGLEEPVATFGEGDDLHLPEGTPTLASLFAKLGYRTSLIGKWHVGGQPRYSPRAAGYEYYLAFEGGWSDYQRYELWENDQRVERSGYLTDVLTAQAISELETANRSGRPFLMSLHYNAPHWPWEGPGDPAQPAANRRQYDGGSLAKYAEMVAAMDAGIGRLMAKLKSLGLERDTIVIFSSDNGGERFSESRPLIGYKGELLEGGIRVPTLMRWPARIGGGQTSDQVILSMDWLPTLLAAAGGEPDAQFRPDGENLLDILTGAAPPKPRKVFWRFKASEQAAVRDGDWKYLKLAGREWLFNLADDQRERANLSKREPERFARMKADYAAWNATMLPYPAKSYSEDLRKLGGFADRYRD